MNTSTTTRLSGVAGALAIKAPVRVATTLNITLSGLQAIDGVTVSADNRVLVKDQDTASENGIYNASTGSWERAKDFNGSRDIVQGTRVLVNQGTVNVNTEWFVSATDPLTIDSSDIDFTATALGPLGLIANGTEALPALAFSTDPDTGVYRVGPNNIGVSVAGSKMLDIVTAAFTVVFGNIVATVGNIVATAGDIIATAGDIAITLGNLDVTTGNVNVAAGDISADAGTINGLVVTQDGNVIFPAGGIIAWATGTPPAGWLLCDGAAVSRTTYAVLFALLGTTYGVGDGSTTFNVPDYEGEFLRGIDNAKANDPDVASRTDRGDGTTGDNVGTKQLHALEDHDHSYDKADSPTSQDPGSAAFTSSTSTASGGVNTSGAFTPLVSANETRARNVAVNWIIRT